MKNALPALSRDIPIDWLLGVREYGLERANMIEDARLELESRLGVEVTFAAAVDYVETMERTAR
jgi:hypothetical protein